MTERPSSEDISTRLQRVATLARQSPEMVFTTLAHNIDIGFLKEAYRRTRKDGAPGVDGETAAKYAVRLEENLSDLLNRFKSGRYKAPPVKRTYIPKGDGTDEKRALGIPTFEDKVLQRAVAMVLEAIYEEEFYDCSYAYRPRRGQHQALDRVWKTLMEMGGGWLVEVDIKDCFGSLDHKHLRECLDRRVRDGVLRKAIDKWLKAGIWEKGVIEHPEKGTPQGGVVSPILANIYLHEVMDKWFAEEVKPRMHGEAHMVRWADDILLIFEKEEDARRVLEVLPKRFGKYGLALHPTKTRLSEFRRPGRKDRKGEGTFDLLGFTHYWKKSRKGNWVIGRKTAANRLRSRVREADEWCRKHRHEPVREQYQKLVRKIRGHYEYYGITGNTRSLGQYLHLVRRSWYKWLRRRAQKRTLNWTRFQEILNHFPLPIPRIRHSYLRASPSA